MCFLFQKCAFHTCAQYVRVCQSVVDAVATAAVVVFVRHVCESISFIFSSLLFDTLQKQSRLQQNIAKGMCAWCIGKSISTIRASNIRTQKRKNGEKEGARIKTGEGLNESKFWELYLVYSMWLSYANVFSISMLSICYWRPELKLASQNIRLAHTHTHVIIWMMMEWIELDWIAMEWMWNTETEREKKNCQVIGKAPISELREKYR